MELSLRLQNIAENVSGDMLLDIGTDHAYIPIFLCKNKNIKKAIACDISKGSVKKAKENIEKYSLRDDIVAKVSDGFKNIDKNEGISDVIIAGMGGMLIIDILKNRKNVVNNNINLILQPQKDIYFVRKYLHSEKFYIKNEKMIIDNEKYYNIIVAKNGIDEKYNENEYFFGKLLLKQKCKILKSYIEKEILMMENIKKQIYNFATKKNIKIFEKKYKMYKEVAKCL